MGNEKRWGFKIPVLKIKRWLEDRWFEKFKRNQERYARMLHKPKKEE